MKKPALLIILFLCMVNGFGVESGADAVLIPRDVYVGDQALLTFSYSLPVPADVSRDGVVLSPESLPQSEDLRIDSVSVRWLSNTAEIRVVFVPWNTGRLEFPLIPFDDSFIQPPAVEIASMLSQGGTASLQPSRPPLLIPGTTWILYGSILAFLLLCTVLWFSVRAARRWLLANPGRRLASRRTRYLNREIRQLRRRLQCADPVLWHGRLSGVIKHYLGRYFPGIDETFPSLTGSELALLSRSHFLSMECDDLADTTGSLIRDLFEVIDHVRFSGDLSATAPDLLLDRIVQLSHYLEEAAANDLP